MKKVSADGGAVTTLSGGSLNTGGVPLDGGCVYFAGPLCPAGVAVSGGDVYWAEFNDLSDFYVRARAR